MPAVQIQPIRQDKCQSQLTSEGVMTVGYVNAIYLQQGFGENKYAPSITCCIGSVNAIRLHLVHLTYSSNMVHVVTIF